MDRIHPTRLFPGGLKPSTATPSRTCRPAHRGFQTPLDMSERCVRRGRPGARPFGSRRARQHLPRHGRKHEGRAQRAAEAHRPSVVLELVERLSPMASAAAGRRIGQFRTHVVATRWLVRHAPPANEGDGFSSVDKRPMTRPPSATRRWARQSIGHERAWNRQGFISPGSFAPTGLLLVPKSAPIFSAMRHGSGVPSDGRFRDGSERRR